MSDLQLVLIGIGGVIIAAVLVFNWWQERRFHQQVEKSFSNIQSDALLDTPLPVVDTLQQSDTDLHAAKVDTNDAELGRDDFSFDLDGIQMTAIDDKEPNIVLPASVSVTSPNNLSTEALPTEHGFVATDMHDDTPGVDRLQDNIDPVELEIAAAEATPANHAGIKAIFEDAFSKNLNTSSPQAAAVQPAAHDDSDQSDLSAASATTSSELALPAALHAQVDLIAVLHLGTEMTVDQVVKAVKNDFDDYDKPVFIHVQMPDQRWLLLSEIATQLALADQKLAGMSCSLQLADRAGPVARSVINRFQLAVESLGLDINAHVEWLNSGDAAADAVALDAFCIDVDKTMGFHLQHGENGAFTGTKLRGLAEAQGLELAADGTFKYYDEALRKQAIANAKSPKPDFVMFNREQYPFSPEMLRSSVIKAVTFQLDIPHVSNCTEAFNHMVLVAKQMETGLHAQLVDDNNRPLGDAQIEKIRHQLKIIQATMMTRGIVPGSDVAQRLFS